jgi:NAD(P)-dependent dehydrogenase (short-subunit alcohol dehydrogenase family)
MVSSAITAETTIVFITGANSGIGYEVARNLSTPSLHANYHVIIGALDGKDGEDAVSRLECEDASRSVSSVQIDVTSDASIAECAQKIDSTHGRIDVLINNAGVLLDGLDTTGVSRSLLEKTFQVNVFGAAAVTETFEALLQKSTSSAPRIVFMSSRLASLSVKSDVTDRSAARHFPAYRSSKVALNMLMLHFANIYRDRGWKVNASDPGLTATSLAGNQKNMGSIEDGARNCLKLATLGVDGKTGSFSNKEGTVPW